jgi:hypothetical protein
MKKRVKSRLNEGTHVSPEVYEILAQLSGVYTEMLVRIAIDVFQKDTSASRFNKNHVFEANYLLSTVVHEPIGEGKK